ncbi:hypothetical protein DPM19_12830 [Actinomadura craniellae]|uniref:Uncharacterized protein n=1 Tax=Actinomadura craniellae TaxID=2231787 RepID=A0A365H696_9ACTN|nr:hypothetical protein [Actinomadura craniellae]RAY14640.1 hypothetical protein DPM19_12830 [Actinomadura craniellae]
MYAWIWRRLPGHGPQRALVALGLILAAVAILWYVIFPWLEPKLQFDRGVVENGVTAPPSSPSVPG